MSEPDTARRLEALACGVWLTSKGQHVPLRKMADGHLINALLRGLAAEEGPALVEPLAREVTRRGLREEALAMASARERRS